MAALVVVNVSQANGNGGAGTRIGIFPRRRHARRLSCRYGVLDRLRLRVGARSSRGTTQS